MKTMYVSFHIGRGGKSNNQGHLSFSREENFQELITRCYDVCTIINRDEQGMPVADEDWTLVEDSSERVILQGREAIEAMTGRLEWDGEYDTDYVTTTDNLSDKELEELWQAYLREDYMSNNLKDEVCTLQGKKRVAYCKNYAPVLAVCSQVGEEDINYDGQVGEFTREQWREDLEERGYCPLSIEKILSAMEEYELLAENVGKRAPRIVIGSRITQLRKARGMTQEELAAATGIRQEHLSRIEAGRYSVGIDTLAKIAEGLGCKIDIVEG